MVKSRCRSTWADNCEHVMVSPVGLYGDMLFFKVLKERKAHMKGGRQDPSLFLQVSMP